MKKSRHTYILLLFTLAILITGCGPKLVPTLYFPQEFKDYTAFHAGSYWVYEEDSFPGLTDTVRITESYYGLIYDVAQERETESFSYFYKLRGFDVHSVATPWYPSAYEELPDYHESFYFEEVYSHNLRAILFFVEGDASHLTLEPSVKRVQVYDQLTIRNQIYHQVVVIENQRFNLTEFAPRRTYWAKGVGVIKREFSDGTSWSLVDYSLK